MKFVLVALFFVASLTFALSGPAPIIFAADNEIVVGQYIVVFHPTTTLEQRNAHVNGLSSIMTVEDRFLHRYEIGEFVGYAGKFSSDVIEQIALSPLVDYIEVDSIVKASQSCQTQNAATWGINRISEQELFLNGQYNYAYSGSGVDAYIIDTGILTTHVDFGGRATFGANYAGGSNADCNGHGTHVAGTVGSNTYGVAKGVNLIAVKVLDCAGSGTNAGVIAGVQWAVTQYTSKKNPAVANMSLGGGKSTSLDNAVKAAITAGISFAVASGNENQDACNISPGGVITALSAGASGTDDDGNFGQEDVRAYFSNWGTCVSLFAPGVLITSTWIGASNTATATISGTSMAAPHVAGAAALYLQQNPTATAATVKSALLSAATPNVIDMGCTGRCGDTANIMLYSSCS